MLTEEIRNIKSSKNELRKFAITLGTVLGLWGGVFLWRGGDYYIYFWAISAAFLLFGLVAPILLKPVHKIWMTLAILLGWLMTKIILSILFYFVVTPISLLARLFGKYFLDLKLDKNTNSYWTPKKKMNYEKSHYENQF